MSGLIIDISGRVAAHFLLLALRDLPKICAGLAKPCGAAGAGLWHSADVIPATLQNLVALSPAIKAEWGVLLRGEPALTPLGRPDTLVYLMDATLAQLFSGLSGKSTKRWLHSYTPLVAPVHAYCACGLNPLLKYYTTGELALRATAAAMLREEIEDVLLLFRSLAQQEIETLCAVCQHKGVPGCCELAGKMTAKPPASTRR